MDWFFPEHVRGWLTESEGRKLAELARGKRVLEIGSFEGRSCICMAQTAERVECIDPLDGRTTPVSGHYEEALFDNLNAFDLAHKVRVHAGTTEEIAPGLKDGAYGFIFIDGDHSLAAVRNDIKHALRLLAPGGVLAFHDYQSSSDPDVTVAVNGLLAAGGELVEVRDSLAVVRPGARRAEGKPVVALAMPRRGAWVAFGASEGFHLWPTSGGCEVARMWTANSILDHGFNRLWCAALNLRKSGATHFAMIHDDIEPAQGWLDTLLYELLSTGADIVSTVVPIKGPEGTTSTAIETADPWCPRRLTLHEVHALPETFGDDEAGGELLLNSGLWVCDIRRPWVDTPEPLVFQTLNRIVQDDNGEHQAQVRSEDWEFSRAARARGARLLATRKVSAIHHGEAPYPNYAPWGAWETDEIHKPKGEPVCV